MLDADRKRGSCDDVRALENGEFTSGTRRRIFDGGGTMDVRLKRAYEQPSPSDGYRVLIDRLWPRGVSKTEAGLDDWVRELAPSTELRRWFGHDPKRFAEFRRRYVMELRRKRPQLAELRRHAKSGRLTLVYSAHDIEHNDAVVLAEILRRGLPSRIDAAPTIDWRSFERSEE